MLARRWATYYLPVEHINGKMAPSRIKCHNQPDTSESDNFFYYGYRHRKRPNVSRYALRDRARNLSVNPYTQGEEQQKALFTDSVAEAKSVLSNPTKAAAAERDFRSQRRYVRLYNYAIAMIIANGGVSPW